ncbi:lytic murein transglycosylase B [Halioglobus japonicus]|uniref:Lytic murein transglycosylase B n=2 Tax=Halioglobus japonicus TaxID=930805 RepID=A0AAP8MFJ4_9GAMM|nr:lytic murein transglycosylase B [Halioglobus japonicus]AQA20180.1 lytic murein transglycosylase B [Halioglobus japonicus]PLW86935.1 lytic murein transglycosylase B [Halioglobus japonicus]
MHTLLKSALAAALMVAPLALAQPHYGDNPAALAVIDQLVEEEGFDRDALVAIMSDAERQESIINAMNRPAEKIKAWHEYRKIFLNDQRIRDGQQFYRDNREALKRAEAETGVPAEIIVAIIGVETLYGKIRGSYRVIDALSTLAFDYPRRSEFFTSELKHYLILTRDQGMDPLTPVGSYAGAMGYGQFMPSSYRNYAIDFDGDGKADIWENKTDAIGSVANYFVEHGWQPGQKVVLSAEPPAEVPEEMLSRGRKLKPRYTLSEFAAAGFEFKPQNDDKAMAIAIEFEQPASLEYWLGLENFYVITRYNHSAMYAMAVYQLSMAIGSGMRE